MKLFFYCQKIGFLKIYSSIIREAINRNHLVEVCFDQIESDTYEIKKRFTDNYLNSKNLEFKILKTNNELVDYLALNKDIDNELKKLAHPIALLICINIIELFIPSLQFSITFNKWIFLALNIVETVFWIYVFLKLVKVVMKMYSSISFKVIFLEDKNSSSFIALSKSCLKSFLSKEFKM